MITPKVPTSAPPSTRRDPQTYAIIGAALNVYNELGHGFLETVYQDALQIEFTLLKVPFIREHPVQILYRGNPVASPYRCDFLCFGQVIVELKAIQRLTRIEEAQTIHYLKATNLSKAVLLNFGGPSLEHKRFIHGPPELFGSPLRKANPSTENL